MKKLLALLLLVSTSIAGASAEAIKFTTINFTIHGQKKEANPNWLPAGVVLYQIKNGKSVKVGFQRPDGNWDCTFKVDVKEGMFFFSRGGGKGGSLNYALYLKAGENKKIDVFYTKPVSLEFDSCVVDKPNAETKSLQAWLTTMNQYKAETAKIPLGNSLANKYEQFQKAATSFLASNKTANAYFNTWLADKVYTDIIYLKAAGYFRFGSFNAKYDSSSVVQSFYKPLNDKKIINDPRLLRSENGMGLLDYTFGYRKVNAGNSSAVVVANYFSSENASEISNSTVKVGFLLHKLPGIKKYEDFIKYIEPNKNIFITEEEKAEYNKTYNDLSPFAKGKPGYNFELRDVNDKIYTLAGFKGKVVVVDMWAMWCAPCLAEKPVMEKIAENYHDRNDIVFVGVSTDGLNKKDLWKGFVKRQGFTSIELISNYYESIQKYYKIEGIPRFLIFDREGKIVTVDAPRPSSPGFKTIIDETLASAK